MAYQPPKNLTCGFCHQEAIHSQSFFSAAPPEPGVEGSATEHRTQAPRHFGVQYACANCGVQRTRNLHYQNSGDSDAAADDKSRAAVGRVHAFELIHASWPAGRASEKFVHFQEVVTADEFAEWSVVARMGRAAFGHGEAGAHAGFGVGAEYEMLPALLASKGNEGADGEETELGDDETVVHDETVSGEGVELEGDETIVHDETVSGEAVTSNGEASSSEKAELQEVEDFEIDFLSDLEDSNDIEDSKSGLINGNGKRRRESDAWSQVSELLEEKVDPTWQPSASKKSKTGGSRNLAETDVAAEPRPRPARKRRNKKA